MREPADDNMPTGQLAGLHPRTRQVGQTPEAELTKPTPAGTVLLLRDGKDGIEVLMLQRNPHGSFASMWVFPGGQVDAADLVARPTDGATRHSGESGGQDDLSTEIEAARRAAAREAEEEAGLAVDERDLVTLAFWLPPTAAIRQFSTWFFIAPVPAGEVVVDGREIVGYRWVRPAELEAERQAGRMDMVPPTYMSVHWLTQFPTVAAALAGAARQVPPRYSGRAYALEGTDTVALLWEGDTGYEDGDIMRPGTRRRLWMTGNEWRPEMSTPE